MSAGPAAGDLYAHLTDDELRARLRQRWCSEDWEVDWLVSRRDTWPANEAIDKWLRA